MNKDTMNKELMACLVWAGGMMALALRAGKIIDAPWIEMIDGMSRFREFSEYRWRRLLSWLPR